MQPILDLLDSILALIIFVPEIRYNEIDQNTLNIVTKEFLRN